MKILVLEKNSIYMDECKNIWLHYGIFYCYSIFQNVKENALLTSKIPYQNCQNCHNLFISILRNLILILSILK